MIAATAFSSSSDFLAHALRLVNRELLLEFGIATRQTISHIAKLS
jgi:hypothetical protein